MSGDVRKTPLQEEGLRAIDQAAGRRLREARKRAGRSQGWLGAAIGVSFQQIQKYERGIDGMSLKRAWAAARALGIEVADFLDHASVISDVDRKSRRKASGDR